MLEEATLCRLIEARAEATPTAPMAVDERGRSLDFAGYHAACLTVAHALSARGLGPDRLVSWMLPTRLEALVLVGALARLDARQNPILPIYRGREVRFIVGQAKPALLVTPGVWRGFDYAAMAREIAADHPGVETLVVEEGLPGVPQLGIAPIPTPSTAALPAPPRALPAAELPVRWLFYSSGTTADPKGALHTDATLWAAAKGMALGLELDASDRIAFVFPFTHIGGFAWLLGGLATGACQILIENFAAPDTMAVLRRNGVTLGTAGTVFHEAYLRAARACPDPPLFPGLRAFPGGGAPKPPQLHDDLVAEFGGAGICSGWGLTEAPNLSMVHVRDPDAKKAQTEGRPSLPEVDLRAVRSDGSLAGPGEAGELRVRGPHVCRGYLDARLDAAAFDEHGYFRTGDLGMLDAEGYVTITGRLKDVIIRKGENIPAKEVEDLLYTHPKVAEVAVIGLPDPKTGERCCAVVVTRDPADPLRFDEMQRFLREAQLMTQKIPEQLELVPELPRNPTGKILKHALRARYARSETDPA
ncbi:MAG: AMP-binding protein [Deltaproteobacteria bacterium]|nr:AMP-binding protein [Deltaproteobacteria bacterium]